MEIKAENVSPEVVAVIAAAVQKLGGVGAVSIKRMENWARQNRRQHHQVV